MKNITEEDVKLYNEKLVSAVLPTFLEGSMVHLEEDIPRFKKAEKKEALEYLCALQKDCHFLQEIVLTHKPLTEECISRIEALNKYNTAKKTELKRLVLFAAVVTLLSAAASFLLR